LVEHLVRDGLYQVKYKGICAGFVVSAGKVIACAPILRKRFKFWKTIAQRLSH